jgi:hypothetical protein
MRLVLLAALPVTLLTTLLLTSSPAPSAEPRADPLVDQVRDAIKNGVEYLQSKKKDVLDRGICHWEDNVGARVFHQGGWTSLALLALLNSGVTPDKPEIQGGLAYLRTIPPSRTYIVALQTMVYSQAGQAVDRERIQRNVDWLIAAKAPNGWSYGGEQSTVPDNSNTQYALLGLHEGIQAGARVDAKVLEELRDFYIRTQTQGGWSYRGRDGATMTMTTAGVCGLMIAGVDLAIGKQVLREDGSAVNCGVYDENKPVADGLNWIGARFPSRISPQNLGAKSAPFYCLYGIERTGRLTGQRYFGGHDWYRLGCEYLVSIQKRDGSWEGPGLEQLDHHPIVATSFSLLFLSKGRTPILITKLAHGPGDGWNNKRSDCRHLVEFASRELFKKQPMAWQVFDVRRKDAEDIESQRQLAAELLPSPIVYLNGHLLRISGKEKSILTEYVNNGGFLLAEACCGDLTFDRQFREMIQEMFPDNELRPVPADHPVWYASGKFVVKPDAFPLWGIQQGCKWVVMYSPKPLAGYWEANQHSQGRGKIAFQLGANIISYATGLEAPRPRLTEVAIMREDVAAPMAKRGFLEVGQLAHDGDWKPAPRAMRFLMEECRKTGLDVLLSTAQVPLSPGIPLENRPGAPVRKIEDVRFFYLHGRRDFTPGAEQVKQLRFNLESGGTLLADACCGSRAFDEAFRKFMEQMWSEKKLKLEPIPLNDELYSRELNGVAIQSVRCRREGADGKRVTPEFQSVPPALEGIKINGRWVVIYSRYDIGCALEKHGSSDCLGHDFASAALLGKAAVLYALMH